MPHAFAILRHAVAMLLYEPRTTLRVVAPGLALIFLSAVLGVINLPEGQLSFPNGFQDGPQALTPAQLLPLIVFLVIYLCGFGLLAVLWHRHVLMNGLDRTTGSHPKLAVLISYAKHAVLLALIFILVTFILMLCIGIGLAIIGQVIPQPPIILLALTSFLPTVIVTWFSFRLGLVLPAAAMGRPITFGDSRALSKPLANALWPLALMLSGLNFVFALLDSAFAGIGTLGHVVVATALAVVQGLILASVLTTLYGHLVEGRELSAEPGQDI